jgi:hypothetical protein
LGFAPYYVAAVLWVLFLGYMCLSLFVFPNRFRAYVGFFLLFGMSIWITGKSSLLSVAFFLSPVKHFYGFHFHPVPLDAFAALLAGLLLALGTIGYSAPAERVELPLTRPAGPCYSSAYGQPTCPEGA